MSIERELDRDKVRAELRTDPLLWKSIGGETGNDFADDAIFLRHGPLGYTIFHAVAPGTYMGHANFYSKYWGKKGWHRTLQATREAFDWMFSVTEAHRIVAEVSHDFPQVQRFCSRIGMTLTGRDAHSEYFEIRKPEPNEQPQ